MVIFGNTIKESVYKSALRAQKKYIRKFGDDRDKLYHLALQKNDVLSPAFNCQTIVIDSEADQDFKSRLPDKAIIIGNIRMGFGHYRISMAMASAASSRGTGYNYYNGNNWINSSSSSDRIENVKTGWGTMTCVGNAEIVCETKVPSGTTGKLVIKTPDQTTTAKSDNIKETVMLLKRQKK